MFLNPSFLLIDSFVIITTGFSIGSGAEAILLKKDIEAHLISVGDAVLSFSAAAANHAENVKEQTGNGGLCSPEE